MKKLSASQRHFFARLSRSAFENPFSDSRLLADACALGAQSRPSETTLEALLQKLDAELAALIRQQGAIRLSDYAIDDQEPLFLALHFQLFHRFRPALDEHILEQDASPEAILPAPKLHALYTALLQLGLPPDKAANSLAIFFQLRRAYYFIHTGLQGDSASMKRLRIQLWNAIFTCDTTLYFRHLWNRMEDFSTLLLGETGTGKGTAAAALGRSGFIPYLPEKKTFSESFVRAFLPINLSEFSESLIESELFGHRKGAFTGAISDYDGVFSRCSGHGAIFLDEIGDVSTPIQIKLLQVLQQRTFSPVGGHDSLRFSGRVIAATHQDLATRRAEGRFRHDFYYRLSSSQIVLPTLRERIAENPAEQIVLLEDIVQRLLGVAAPDIVDRVNHTLSHDLPPTYAWPGNVRELEQATRSILLTGHYLPAPLPPLHSTGSDPLLQHLLEGTLSLAQANAWYCNRLVQTLGSYEAAAARLGIDWRTVKQKIAALPKDGVVD